MPVSVATWNINSVRLRIRMVLRFLRAYQPDVLMLQEIKCTNDQFPRKAFARAGWPYHAVHGQKAGGDLPDPELNWKFKHKLDFLAELKEWFADQSFASRQLIAGDFNVAPHENDVWSHKQLLKIVSHTPVETEALKTLLTDGHGWVDLVRKYFPYDQKLYSWWSYRAPDWEKADKGRRLDHIWSTTDIAEHTTGAEIVKPARGWGTRPSDHVPVIVRFDA